MNPFINELLAKRLGRDKINEDLKNEIAAARQNVNREPTDGQKHAGNYKMGHVRVNGYDISLENPKGSYRRGVDPDGKKWSCKMYHDYGYFRSTLGRDGDAIDVFIGDDYDSKKIFVIDQIIKGKFDESKVMFCFKSEEEAMKGYLANYEKGWSAGKHITEVSDDIFREWLYDGYKQRKPFYQYVKIKQNKLNEGYQETYDIAARLIKDGYLVHGTSADFQQFNSELINGGFRGSEGWGFYFSDMPYKPAEYGERLYYVRRDLFRFLPYNTTLADAISNGNGKRLSASANLSIEKARLEHELENCRNTRDYDRLTAAIEDLDNRMGRVDKQIENRLETALHNIDSNATIRTVRANLPSDLVKPFFESLLNLGYDGVVDDHVYVIFNMDKLNRYVRKAETPANETLDESWAPGIPKVCPKCGSKVGLYISGEPVYLCSNKDCREYFGTMPFPGRRKKSVNEVLDKEHVGLMQAIRGVNPTFSVVTELIKAINPDFDPKDDIMDMFYLLNHPDSWNLLDNDEVDRMWQYMKGRGLLESANRRRVITVSESQLRRLSTLINE